MKQLETSLKPWGELLKRLGQKWTGSSGLENPCLFDTKAYKHGFLSAFPTSIL